MQFYAFYRTRNVQGVTIAAQRRYVKYVHSDPLESVIQHSVSDQTFVISSSFKPIFSFDYIRYFALELETEAKGLQILPKPMRVVKIFFKHVPLAMVSKIGMMKVFSNGSSNFTDPSVDNKKVATQTTSPPGASGQHVEISPRNLVIAGDTKLELYFVGEDVRSNNCPLVFALLLSLSSSHRRLTLCVGICLCRTLNCGFGVTPVFSTTNGNVTRSVSTARKWTRYLNRNTLRSGAITLRWSWCTNHIMSIRSDQRPRNLCRLYSENR